MKVLAINCGSSTLKFDLIEVRNQDEALGQEQRLASGIIDKIGGQSVLRFATKNGERLQETARVTNHGQAARRVLDWLSSLTSVAPDGVEAVGHRVVHGGDRFLTPTLIDNETIDAIEALTRLAPLHNKPSLEAIRIAKETLPPAVLQVATFDTAFHASLPKRASMYAIPLELAERHGVRRYGFHGLAHRYMSERYAAMTCTPVGQGKVITLQLGNGCSATAVGNGRSVDTSMGFTPLEGLVMGTRSGDLDPSLVGLLARQERVAVDEVENWLNTRSGLLGISGRSGDMREVLKAEAQGDARAALAVEMFCYRARKYIGAYLAVLGGADAVVFGGGIGENSPEVRSRVCAGMDWCGLVLDEKLNTATIGTEARVSADCSRVHAYVIPVDEGVIIARDTVSCLHRQQR